MALIYIVDDEQDIRDMLKSFLDDVPEWEVYAFKSADEVLVQIEKGRPDVVVSDFYMPGIDGMDLLRELNRVSPETEFIMITGYGDQETAIEAMEIGAYDYLKKPLNLKEFRLVIERALKSKKMGDKLSYLYNQQRKMFGFGELIGSSPEMQRVFKIIRMVSESKDTPVVIRGETGTGKEMVARAIHDSGQRKQENFVEVNCAAIPDTLLESELFGHEEGAFTDARKSKRGLMEVANGGTFFLDELASMHPNIQVKLLKAIEEKRIRRVGGVKDIPIDVRVLASTSQSLEELIDAGKFREDLYYRLNVISVELPPLRERGDDIILLTEHFIEQFNDDFNYEVNGITEDATDILMEHDWPGNVRELRNLIERAVLLKKSGEIDTHHLTLIPSSLDAARNPQKMEHRVFIPEGGIDFDALEKKYLEAALKRTHGNKSKAAKLLGMSRSTFRYRLKKFFGEENGESGT